MELEPVATVQSPLTDRAAAPKQGDEGAPEAWLLFEEHVAGKRYPGWDLLNGRH
jgi:hypothetical protein